MKVNTRDLTFCKYVTCDASVREKTYSMTFSQNLPTCLSLSLQFCAYAFAYVDTYGVHFVAFLCFAFCLSLRLRLKWKPGLSIFYQTKSKFT